MQSDPLKKCPKVHKLLQMKLPMVLMHCSIDSHGVPLKHSFTSAYRS